MRVRVSMDSFMGGMKFLMEGWWGEKEVRNDVNVYHFEISKLL